jgi:polyisoprenoid-binding protein YceI
MTRTRLVVVAIVALFVVGGVGLYIARDQVLGGDSVPALTLPSAAPSAAASSGASAAASADPAATASSATAPASGPVTAASLAGDWTLVTDASTAGYRVRERLAQLDADSDAVGRSTTGVTGAATLTVSGDAVQVTAATIDVDTTTIASDRSQRDNRLRNEGLQTDSFPTAGFKLTAPVDVPAAALTRAVVDVTLHGDLTLHGVTKTVDIPAKAQLSDGQVQVQGSITFPLSDYGITAPNIGGFIVSIADTGTLEFLVTFSK